jgi:hypothetical protein
VKRQHSILITALSGAIVAVTMLNASTAMAECKLLPQKNYCASALRPTNNPNYMEGPDNTLYHTVNTSSLRPTNNPNYMEGPDNFMYHVVHPSQLVETNVAGYFRGPDNTIYHVVK